MTKSVIVWIVFLSAAFLSVGCGLSGSKSSDMSGGKESGKSAASSASKPKDSSADDSAKPGERVGVGQMYYAREITTADLDNRTLRELNLLRNTIFARAGNPFRKEWLREYFMAQPWYKPLDRMDETKLTALDRKNATFIAEYEARIPRPDLERRKQKLEAKSDADLTKADRIEISLLSRALGENPEGEFAANPTPLDDPRQLDKLLTVDQLRDLSRRDLRLLRNTVYARRGRVFNSPILNEYFERMAWYKPNSGYSDAMLTEIDRKNIVVVRSVEDELGGPLTEGEDRSGSWFGGA